MSSNKSKFEVKKLNDEYYPYGLYYDGKLVSGLTSNTDKVIKTARKKVEKRLGL
jgi:hypothetical protein